jgi:GNAT superfamily N-acetyltransferase
MGEVRQLAEVLGAKLSAPSPITPAHDLSRFKCGKEALDDWLRQRALKSEGLRHARTCVVAHGNTVVGFHSIVMGAVQIGLAPSKLKRNAPDPIPVGILARMAVDVRFRGQGLGAALLKDGLLRILQASEIVGARAVLVHAIDAEALRFYEKYGFKEFPSGSKTLFLPMETLVDGLLS